MSPKDVTTPQRWFTHVRLLCSHLTHHVRLFRSAPHLDSFTEAACGGLRPPPAGRSRRALLHHRCSTTTISAIFYITTSSRVRGTRISTSLSRSLPGSSRSSANALVMPRYASRSSTSRHHRAVTDDDGHGSTSGRTIQDRSCRNGFPSARTHYSAGTASWRTRIDQRILAGSVAELALRAPQDHQAADVQRYQEPES
jgi:hypothetical protein